VRLLIDSHALLWILSSPQQLSAHARSALGDPANERFVSVAALWEIAIKVSVAKLSIPMALDTAVIYAAATPLAITIDHAKCVQTLPFHHRDPFDRMMIAQAMEDGLTIVTRDRHFPAYGVSVLKA
jgi:PIN domain nuclease of toxin-antitoxin system